MDGRLATGSQGECSALICLCLQWINYSLCDGLAQSPSHFRQRNENPQPVSHEIKLEENKCCMAFGFFTITSRTANYYGQLLWKNISGN